MKRGVKFFAAALVALAAGFAFIGCSDGSESGSAEKGQVEIVSFDPETVTAVKGEGTDTDVTCALKLSNAASGYYYVDFYWVDLDGEEHHIMNFSGHFDTSEEITAVIFKGFLTDAVDYLYDRTNAIPIVVEVYTYDDDTNRESRRTIGKSAAKDLAFTK